MYGKGLLRLNIHKHTIIICLAYLLLNIHSILLYGILVSGQFGCLNLKCYNISNWSHTIEWREKIEFLSQNVKPATSVKCSTITRETAIDSINGISTVIVRKVSYPLSLYL